MIMMILFLFFVHSHNFPFVVSYFFFKTFLCPSLSTNAKKEDENDWCPSIIWRGNMNTLSRLFCFRIIQWDQSPVCGRVKCFCTFVNSFCVQPNRNKIKICIVIVIHVKDRWLHSIQRSALWAWVLCRKFISFRSF